MDGGETGVTQKEMRGADLSSPMVMSPILATTFSMARSSGSSEAAGVHALSLTLKLAYPLALSLALAPETNS